MTYKIKTYNRWLISIVFLISIIFIPYLLYLFRFEGMNGLLFFLSLFFLLFFIIGKWLTYPIDVEISDSGVLANWNISLSRKINKKVAWSDITNWDYSDNGMSGAFCIWTKENERLSIILLTFLSTEKSFSQFLKAFKESIEYNNNRDASSSNIIKQRRSFFETKLAMVLAFFGGICAIILIMLLFIRGQKADSFLWLRTILVILSDLFFILNVYSARKKSI